jgi:hypothetical protein
MTFMVYPTHRYSVYGLTVRSAFSLALPEAPRSAPGTLVELGVAEPNALEEVASTVATNENDWFQHVLLEDGRLYMRWEALFDFIISCDGRRVLCRKLADAAMESFEAYLTTFALSGALLQQGEEPLHATVIEKDNMAVGLMGPSGAGKSTLAAFLISEGGDLVTDDMLRIRLEEKGAYAYPGPYRMKLFKEPAERFLKQSLDRGQLNPLTGKLIFQPGTRQGDTQLRRLSALYFLDGPGAEEDPTQISLERLSGIALFKTIAACTMNSRLNMPARLERHFRFAERLARVLPVYRLTYPREYRALHEVSRLISQTGFQ